MQQDATEKHLEKDNKWAQFPGMLINSSYFVKDNKLYSFVT